MSNVVEMSGMGEGETGSIDFTDCMQTDDLWGASIYEIRTRSGSGVGPKAGNSTDRLR